MGDAFDDFFNNAQSTGHLNEGAGVVNGRVPIKPADSGLSLEGVSVKGPASVAREVGSAEPQSDDGDIVGEVEGRWDLVASATCPNCSTEMDLLATDEVQGRAEVLGPIMQETESVCVTVTCWGCDERFKVTRMGVRRLNEGDNGEVAGRVSERETHAQMLMAEESEYDSTGNRKVHRIPSSREIIDDSE